MAGNIRLGNVASTGSVLLDSVSVTNDRTVTFPDASGEALLQGRALTLMTAQNSTSGTSIDFTGIPSWAKRITVMFNGVSTNGSSNIQVQIGSGSIDTTSTYIGSGNSGAGSFVNTTGFIVSNNIVAGNNHHGIVNLSTLGSNVWAESGIIAAQTTANTLAYGAASKTLSATLDRIRITTVNGTDTFDAGSINIMYEG